MSPSVFVRQNKEREVPGSKVVAGMPPATSSLTEALTLTQLLHLSKTLNHNLERQGQYNTSVSRDLVADLSGNMGAVSYDVTWVFAPPATTFRTLASPIRIVVQSR